MLVDLQQNFPSPAVFASIWIVDASIPEARFASVASFAADVALADASSGDEIVGRIRLRLALAVVLTADAIAIAGLTNRRVADRSTRILDVELYTVQSCGTSEQVTNLKHTVDDV